MMEDRYTNGEYLKNNPNWHVEESPWKTKQILKMIDRNLIKPNSISEIGCGAGEILYQLYLKMPENVTFVGYEISPQAFELCQKRKNPRIQFNLKSILDEDNVFFDLILCLDVFEHVEDYFGFLRKLRVKGEYKLFHIPLDLSVGAVLFDTFILERRRNVGHLHYFSKETALATLRDTGYEILDYFYAPISIDLASTSFKKLPLKYPRKIMYSINKDFTSRLLGGLSLMVLAK